MALFPFCRPPPGAGRVTRRQLVLYSLLLSLLIFFLQGRKAPAKPETPPPRLTFFRAPEETDADTTDGRETEAVAVRGSQQLPLVTPWGAPLVWGDSSSAAWRRSEFAQRGLRTGLLVLAVGGYAHFLRRFLSSAELHFLPDATVTYYVLTDSPRALEPPLDLGADRHLKVVPVAELPGWERLAERRMALVAAAIQNPIRREVEYVFCADVDQEFVAPVGEEILGDLVATLHPELYGMPRHAFPYENEDGSSAHVEDGEGDYYYTSELYGGLCAEVYRLAKACSLLILQDQENGVKARGLEESYLNRYLINRKPTCVLSPEYSWWDSALSADVPVERLVSLGRQCEALDAQKREEQNC